MLPVMRRNMVFLLSRRNTSTSRLMRLLSRVSLRSSLHKRRYRRRMFSSRSLYNRSSRCNISLFSSHLLSNLLSRHRNLRRRPSSQQSLLLNINRSPSR